MPKTEFQVLSNGRLTLWFQEWTPEAKSLAPPQARAGTLSEQSLFLYGHSLGASSSITPSGFLPRSQE
ncbi:hypothetical protein JCM15765_17120 [Paradesulfitobacterium aromaticivorans]